jgi:hypothetical protein
MTDSQDGPEIKGNRVYKERKATKAIREISVLQVHKANPVLKVYRVL